MQPPFSAEPPRPRPPSRVVNRPPVRVRRRSGSPSSATLSSLKWGRVAALVGAIGLSLMTAISWIDGEGGGRSPWRSSSWDGEPVPLVMEGGDPYIRALMRTISASESSDPSPYTLLYGGEHVESLREHPDQCIPIIAGPNVGKCTTAAGRYQFLTSTWLDVAEDYHPRARRLAVWRSYSFEPRYQDEVVYAWLSDSSVWGVDIAEKLRAGELAEVLWLLSGTWTSLGYGIESNVMTSALPDIYAEMLEQELQ